jgi:hypothetical protein
MTTATPTKLRNGDWGAKVAGSVRQGDKIQIRTKSGKEWTARVARVLWSGDNVSIVATEQRPRRASNGECECGWGEDLLSWGNHRPGQHYRCPECGGWAEAC